MEGLKNNVSQCAKVIRVFKRPVIIKKHALFKTFGGKNPRMLVKRNITPLYREDLIYESTGNDFLKGEFPPFKLVNILNVATNNSRTVLRYTSNTTDTVERTSDNITRLIGQKNYDTVFSALLSVINQEQKIRSMLGLLQEKTISKDITCSTDIDGKFEINVTHTRKRDTHCQTDETSIDNWKQIKQRRRLKRNTVKPYIVKDTKPEEKCEEMKRIFLNRDFSYEMTPHSKENRSDPIEITQTDIKQETFEHTVEKIDNISLDSNDFPDLKLILDEDSIVSNGSIGNISLSGLSTSNSILGIIEKCTDTKTTSDDNFNPSVLKIIDGSEIIIPVKPEDVFHIATPEILNNVTHHEKRKLLMQQAYYDWKYCLVKGDDNNFPVHLAVLNNDLDLLKRQCLILREVHGSVDVTTDANLTPLQMAIQHNSSPQCTALLLQHGADPMATDEEYRTPLHLAAEGDPQHLQALLDFCKTNARQILKDNEELWQGEFEYKSDEQLATFLLRRMCHACDSQGYTPLMVCSRLGGAAAARLLLAAAPSSVHCQAPGSGDTALYLAVSAACFDAVEKNNRSKVPQRFMDTIEVLLEYGADPAIDNHSGCNVNTMLTDISVVELSVLIANKMAAVQYVSGKSILPHAADAFMLVKDENGDVSIESIESKTNRKTARTYKSAVISKRNIQVLDLKTIGGTSPRKGSTSKKDELTLNKDVLTLNKDELTLNKDELTLNKDELTLNKGELTLKKGESTLKKNELNLKKDESILKKDELTLKRDETKSEPGVVVKLERDIKPVILANVPVTPRVNVAKPSGVVVDHIKPGSRIQITNFKVKHENSPNKIVDRANSIVLKRQQKRCYPPASGDAAAERGAGVGGKRSSSEAGAPGTSKIRKTC